MLTRPPLDAPVDQLVVGALAIDRLPDGSEVPGGTVIHATRALGRAGRRVGVLTVAGREPAARAGVRELRRAATLILQPAGATTTFAIEEGAAGRHLTLVARSGRLEARQPLLVARSTLFGPLADELGPDLAGQVQPRTVPGAALQGWLRSLEPGRRVDPLPLGSLAIDLVARLWGFALLVASLEDLAADGTKPAVLLDAMRTTFGGRPILALTAGPQGAWLDLPTGDRHHVTPPHVVEGVSTVGAGDAFAALMLDRLAAGLGAIEAARVAAAAVTDLLLASKRGQPLPRHTSRS